MISYATEGYLVYNMVYLCLMPIYSCDNLKGDFYECSNYETCSSEVLDFRVEKQTLNNWVQDFDIRCTSKWLIGLYGAIFFFGRLAGNIFLAHYGDSIGRIMLLRVSQAITLISYITIVFLTRNPFSLYVPIFLIGLVSCWRCSLSYIYGQEIINSKY